MAKSYFNEMPDPVARDMTPAVKAMNSFREFLGRFPTAPEVPEARKCLQELVNRLAEKEVYIATFYLKRGNQEAARARYQKVIDLYPESENAKLARKKLSDIGPKKEAANSHAPNTSNLQ
jgi:outer membrane protein assembly factor BamD